jgi:acyl-coenzyme A synthetase/AMP-(fatty) acid ligase
MSDTATILERLEDYTQREPNAAILFDETHTGGITYAQLDDMSGRIYAWLKEEGIGKDQFVLINLPRGIMPVIYMIGVWKAGAAWALVEDTYAPERIEYIRKDCGCKLELTESLWETIMETEPLSGHEAVDPHDAAYAIYTSGTTGNPKGVLHEYGNLERAIDSIRINGETPFDGRDSLALLAPLNFVASVIVILKALSIRENL